MAGTAVTKVTVVKDINTNPPDRSAVEINKDADYGDLVLANNIGFDASLTLGKGVEFYLDSNLAGLRWQFLNNGNSNQVWTAAVLGAIGSKDKTTSQSDSTSSSEAKSDVDSSQVGLSVGYKFTGFVPYVSYIHETHKVSTTVTNSHGNFGPYEDNGVHDYYSIGISTHSKRPQSRT